MLCLKAGDSKILELFCLFVCLFTMWTLDNLREVFYFLLEIYFLWSFFINI